MTAIRHDIAPEEIMAMLDGELSPTEVRVVMEHLEGCRECATLAEDLRMTSQGLAEWSVPVFPAELERAIRDEAAEAGVRERRRVVWRWKPWVFAGGAVAALGLLVVSLSVPKYSNAKPMAISRAEPQSELRYLNARGNSFSIDGELDNSVSQSFDSNGVVSMLEKAPPIAGEVGELSALQAPMIARMASLTIEVKNVEAARTALDAVLARHHGYAAQMTVNTPDYGQRTVQGSLRVPVGELGPALADLKGLGRVETESQSDEEVSQQHADLEARLKTSRDTEERFRSILQQRTGSVADVMAVQEGIARVRGEIEAMEAEQRGLDHRVNFASIEITLNEEYKARLDAPGDLVGTQVRNAFVQGYHHATGTVLGSVLFLEEYGPALLIWCGILGVPVVLFWRRYRKERRRF